MEIVVMILTWLSPVIIAVLTILATALAKKLLDKLGVERTAKTDELVTNLVGNAVSTVERVAMLKLKEHGLKLAGSDKKAEAVKIVLDELQAAGIRDVARKVVENRIEAFLHINDPKVSPASPPA
jgi:hypothetical protein